MLTIPISQKTPSTERTHFMQPRWLCSSENVPRILKLSLEIDATMRTKSLPQESIPDTEILQCYIPKNVQPKCSAYTLDTTPSNDVTKKAEQNDLAWSVGNSIIRSRLEQGKIPTLAPYNSQVLSLLSTVSMMPLLAATAHEWSTMLTVLMQAQKITAHTKLYTIV